MIIRQLFEWLISSIEQKNPLLPFFTAPFLPHCDFYPWGEYELLLWTMKVWSFISVDNCYLSSTFLIDIKYHTYYNSGVKSGKKYLHGFFRKFFQRSLHMLVWWVKKFFQKLWFQPPLCIIIHTIIICGIIFLFLAVYTV